jgi:hypothetical protein
LIAAQKTISSRTSLALAGGRVSRMELNSRVRIASCKHSDRPSFMHKRTWIAPSGHSTPPCGTLRSGTLCSTSTPLS